MKRILTLLLSINTLTLSQILEIHQINVSQGDACYIQINAQDTIKFLIDAGNQGKGNNTIIPYLNSLNVNSLNFTIASHYHADHIGGLDEVINHFKPTLTACYDRGGTYNSNQFTQYVNSADQLRRTLNPKDTILNISTPNHKIILTCIASNGKIWNTENQTNDENTLSIALLLEFNTNQDTFRFFTAGDLYAKQESLIAASLPLKINLMKISHHGSKTSISPFMINTFQPQNVIIPVGDNNPYGHPHQETIQKLDTTQTIRFIYQTETGARTGNKSIVAGNIIAKVYDKFYTISTSNFTRTDTFYFANDNTLSTENYPFEKDSNQKRENMRKIKTYTTDSNFYVDIFTPQETIQTVQVYNILGQLIHENQPLSNEKFTLKIPQTASGIYMIIVKTNKNIYHEKITLVK